MSETITCPFCGGSGAEHESSRQCVACRGTGVIVDTGPPQTEFVTERYTVTGRSTERVIVTWPDGTELTIYRP